MKWRIFSVAMGALVLIGCASNDRYAHRDQYRHADHDHVYVNQNGERIYVRDNDPYYRGAPDNRNNMEPRVRGKHADSLGWNEENYYLQRGYKR